MKSPFQGIPVGPVDASDLEIRQAGPEAVVLLMTVPAVREQACFLPFHQFP